MLLLYSSTRRPSMKRLHSMLVAAVLLTARSGAAHDLYGPLFFEPNRGQAPEATAYLARGQGMTALLNVAGGVRLSGGAADGLEWRLAGASADIRSNGRDPQPGASNYLKGPNSSGWLRRIPHYGRIHYDSIYAGIDLEYHAGQDTLEYDFLLSPDAKPDIIRLQFPRADHVRIDAAGDLWIEQGGRSLRQKKPVAYQETPRRTLVTVSYVRRGRQEIGFELGPYDRRLPLVIDPEVDFAAYLGGVNSEAAGFAIATDPSQNIYVTGRVLAPKFAGRPEENSFDAFV